MDGFITIYDATFDEYYCEMSVMHISRDSVIWAGEDYDGNTVVSFTDGDCVRVVRCSNQTVEEVLNES